MQDESLCINMLTQKWKIKGSLRRCEEEDERRPEQKQKQRLARVPLANDLYLIRASRFRGEPCCSEARLLVVKSLYKFTIPHNVHALLLQEGSSHPVWLKPLFQSQGGSGCLLPTRCHFASPAGTVSFNDTAMGMNMGISIFLNMLSYFNTTISFDRIKGQYDME